MIIIVSAVVAITGLSVAGVAYLVYLLHRDRHLVWHPGDPLPDLAGCVHLGQIR